jgi:peptidoglycan/xylan/chitin deacetylase (PgdA/CDA1 family)
VALSVLAVATGWWRMAVRSDPARIARASVATPTPSPPTASPLSGADATLEGERIVLPHRSDVDVARAVQRLLVSGEAVRCGGGNQPVVALAFEDGPGPHTERTVRLLEERGASATFFLNGTRLESFGSVLPAILEVGEIGNHGWSHRGLVGADPDLLTAEVDVLQARLAEIADTPLRLFRPPHYARDEALDERALSLGLLTVLSSVDAGDDEAVGPSTVWSTLERGIRPGAIVTLRENQEVTQELLPDLLDLIEERGLHAVTVPELLTLDPPSRRQLLDGTCPSGS